MGGTHADREVAKFYIILSELDGSPGRRVSIRWAHIAAGLRHSWNTPQLACIRRVDHGEAVPGGPCQGSVACTG